MIEWIWPLAFSLLPLPWLVRRFLKEAKQDRPALIVPSLEPFIGGAKDEVAEWKYMNLKILLQHLEFLIPHKLILLHHLQLYQFLLKQLLTLFYPSHLSPLHHDVSFCLLLMVYE